MALSRRASHILFGTRPFYYQGCASFNRIAVATETIGMASPSYLFCLNLQEVIAVEERLNLGQKREDMNKCEAI
ncbi:MAG: hypothetical protein V4508_19635 [Pseudomonadota bacterium]